MNSFFQEYPDEYDADDGEQQQQQVEQQQQQQVVVEDGSSVFGFGKNKGKTFVEVFAADKSYVGWALSQADHGALAPFVAFCRARDPALAAAASPASAHASRKREADDNVISAAGTVTVGKHKGRTFDDVMKNEPSYCEWIMKSELTGNLNELQKYIASATGVASNIAAPSPAKKAASQGNNVTSVVPSGKHQGKSFADMVKKERSYCEWIMGLTDIKAQWMKDLKNYAYASGIRGSSSASSHPDRGFHFG